MGTWALPGYDVWWCWFWWNSFNSGVSSGSCGSGSQRGQQRGLQAAPVAGVNIGVGQDSRGPQQWRLRASAVVARAAGVFLLSYSPMAGSCGQGVPSWHWAVPAWGWNDASKMLSTLFYTVILCFYALLGCYSFLIVLQSSSRTVFADGYLLNHCFC